MYLTLPDSGIQVNPNPPSMVAPDITLPINVDNEVPQPEFREFISYYTDTIQKTIPAVVDNVVISVNLYIEYSINERANIGSLSIKTRYDLYNRVDHSLFTIVQDVYESLVELRYCGISIKERAVHSVDP